MERTQSFTANFLFFDPEGTLTMRMASKNRWLYKENSVKVLYNINLNNISPCGDRR